MNNQQTFRLGREISATWLLGYMDRGAIKISNRVHYVIKLSRPGLHVVKGAIAEGMAFPGSGSYLIADLTGL